MTAWWCLDLNSWPPGHLSSVLTTELLLPHIGWLHECADVPIKLAGDCMFVLRHAVEEKAAEVREEAPVFTGQRLNKKMQVYSGAKVVYLPSMMTLYQQCIRTLQNNIDCEWSGSASWDYLWFDSWMSEVFLFFSSPCSALWNWRRPIWDFGAGAGKVYAGAAAADWRMQSCRGLKWGTLI